MLETRWLAARRRGTLTGVLVIGLLTGALILARPALGVISPSLESTGPSSVAAGATLAPDRSGTVTPEAPFTWAGAVASGHNQSFDPAEAGPCGKTVADYCDITLVDVVPGNFYEAMRGGVEFSTGGARPGTDLDLFVFESDASGKVGDFVGASGGATDEERVSIVGATGFYLVVAVYFQATDTGYDGRAEFFQRNPTPADVDDPEGLQDSLVSDPGRGFKSHSEPHLSQDPTNPRILVGGSKMYNLDRDSLAEYEFKIGTYASFDRGRSWADLGQLNVCPAAAARAPRTPATTTARATTARSTSPRTSGPTSTTRATRTRWCSTRRRSRAATGGA
jgi:hypothetical protein